jgi:hypothetical protein
MSTRSLGSLTLDLVTRLGGWTQGLSQAERQARDKTKSIQRSFNDLGAAVTKAFALIGGGAFLTNAIRQSIQIGDEISKASTKAGIGAQEFSELAYAVKTLGDVEAPTLTTALREMQFSLADAAAGNQKALATFSAIGVSFEKLRQQKPDKQFETIAEAISRIEDPALRARTANELLGKAGAELLPAFEQGAAGIQKAREEAEKMGRAFSEEDVARMKEADGALKSMAASWDKLAKTGAVRLAPVIAEAADGVRTLLGGATELEKLQNQLQFLERTQDQAFMLNLGFTDGPLVMSSADMKERIKELREQIKGLKGDLQSGAAPNEALFDVGAGLPRDAGYDELIHEVRLSDVPRYDEFQNLKQQAEAMAEYRRTLEETYQYSQFVSEEILNGVSETSKDLTAQLEEHFDGVGYELDELLDKQTEMSVYAEQAARNMQDHFAEFLFDPFKDGLDGMLKGFIDVIRRMVAEAAAAKIFDYLGGGSDGGWLTSLLGAFGGGKAKGGPLESGKWYIAGEHGPEPIWGGGPGAFAMGYGGGGMVVKVNNTFNNVRDLSDEKMSIYARRISDATIARIRDEDRRGTRR